MANLALIVAGSGETSEAEVNDLLNDAYPEDDYNVDLFVPVDKDEFTKTVQNAVAWFNNDDLIYTVQTEGASMTRASSRLGEEPIKVESLKDVLNPKDFEGWDEVHFLVALPEDPEDPDYDRYADLVAVAIENSIPVKDLTRGLDDVQISDEEETPEPEPEPEKPVRKRRERALKIVEDKPEEPVAEAEERHEDGLQQEIAAAAYVLPKTGLDDRDILASFLHKVQKAAGDALTALYANPVEPAEEPEAAPEEPKKTRGRGRPRTNFEIAQIWDEDEQEWVPRPKGRLAKGTKWRKIHSETDATLEEGTA